VQCSSALMAKRSEPRTHLFLIGLCNPTLATFASESPSLKSNEGNLTVNAPRICLSEALHAALSSVGANGCLPSGSLCLRPDTPRTEQAFRRADDSDYVVIGFS
jgi:hypothetical protein